MTTKSDLTAPFSVIIVAAGSGSRMNSDIPKQYLTLSGRPILRHTMDIFANHPNLKSMIVAINPDHQALYTEATKDFVLPILTVAGGSTRQHTVKNALNALSE
ncbi:MAG TPA: 2-C-methyl-D-erythritol 4-phosphate cytidylyltransferase, partial [Alphaproteobacteria bacterium]|nr:2-C-methyl-D-erythritol 4-phosphate cytidylyltransferase [Alphaproteobacteria bacterium]